MTIALSDYFLSSNCRTYTVPTCESSQLVSTLTIPVAATFQLRQRDQLDFSVDLRAFLTSIAADIVLASVVFNIASSVTQAGVATGAPTIVGSGFDPAGMATAVVKPNAAAAVGDIYAIDMVATTTQTTLAGGVVIPARTITRRLALTVVAG